MGMALILNVKTMKGLKLKAEQKSTQWWALNCCRNTGGWEERLLLWCRHNKDGLMAPVSEGLVGSLIPQRGFILSMAVMFLVDIVWGNRAVNQ